ncbi:PREDICTED: uncharacterized protein LOC109157228 [Ipomoea nil]|uniref:uncharacterized protein LOC109157228 n=1 Tax=Ipomoea nil TaxID=35883 RepID=UPI0009019FC7|nr:PREDICTED: uncharacterized protein LOC109157228 [Ipomoea nil]
MHRPSRWANKYAETEEALRQKTRREAKRPRDETRTRPLDRPSKREERSNVIRGPLPPRHRAVPALGVRHLHEVQPPRPTENLPPPPTRAEERPAAGRARYCRYHRSTGHSTEECITLQKEIEELIQKGRSTARPNQWRKLPWTPARDPPTGLKDRPQQKAPNQEEGNPEEQDDRNWKHKRVIHMICGGPAVGDSSRERKRWARQLYVGAVQHRPPIKKGQRDIITFFDEDLPNGPTPHRDALIITMDINGTTIWRVFVDTGSSVNVMYLETFNKLGLSKEQLHLVRTPLAGFTGDSIEAEGCLILPVEIGEYPRVRSLDMEFVVVNINSAHNVILGRPGLEDLGAVVSLEHLCLKFRTPEGVGIAKCDRHVARSCYLLSCRQIGRCDLQVQAITEKTKGEETKERPEPVADLEEVALEDSRPDRTIKIGKGLTEEVRLSILQTLKECKILFAWGPEDMPGIDRSVITHRLSV